ncbi:helix-turn-helix transcriptional regulator [Cupriavidus sp. H19C3]|uniref:helix-turn-helix transcriptional regulator n=1 Tax=Cupriavidus sp. H19C3 TaxID=3241603 RepID=UPI003BF84A92
MTTDSKRYQEASAQDMRSPLLVAIGERTRSLRARRGLTRKAVALTADVSERHIANLEHGTGNASILVLQQIANALQCSLSELIGDVTTSSPEWLLLRELLENRSEADLRRVRIAVGQLLGTDTSDPDRSGRFALIGLRGAGKSTLGKMLAEAMDIPFVELNREIEKVAGCSVSEIHGLYGTSAYRRYERRALEEVIQLYRDVVIATPGGIVSDPATFNELLAHCTTIWLQADPEDHMSRVIAQGDSRPMGDSRQAMEDLRQILSGRAPFYSQADMTVDTSGKSLAQAFALLRKTVGRSTETTGLA